MRTTQPKSALQEWKVRDLKAKYTLEPESTRFEYIRVHPHDVQVRVFWGGSGSPPVNELTDVRDNGDVSQSGMQIDWETTLFPIPTGSSLVVQLWYLGEEKARSPQVTVQ